MQHYKDRPEVILVCVKGYSLDGIYEFIRRIAKPQTIVIPILNIYGTGAKMQEKLPGMLVTDGCIYVSANIKEPGVILQHGFRKISVTVQSMGYYQNTSSGMRWRNFPMCHRSERRAFT